MVEEFSSNSSCLQDGYPPRHQPPYSLKYVLRCLSCGAEYPPDSFRLHCDRSHAPALLRTVYSNPTLQVKPELPGLFQFSDWLPSDRHLETAGKPITYASQHLAAYLKLDRLLISFNGYWAERDAQMLTCSFKELEALSVLARIPQNHPRTLVISSAGNTGRAFANICSDHHIPLCLVIPKRNLPAIWSHHSFSPTVRLIAVGGGSDYSDAIALGKVISELDGFFPGGGAANVARRDGMGLTVLDAAVTLGQIPDHYFQAVGSGSGGISAWEANLRLLADGHFGGHHMKLHLAQNLPFTPMVDAWKAGSKETFPVEETAAKARIAQVSAEVLTTRQPAYSLAGGLYEALVSTNGEMYSMTNEEADQARQLFEQLEGIDICPAASVATAALIQAVQAGKVGKQDCILLNITSGGIKRLQQEHSLQHLQPDLVFLPDEIHPDRVAKRIEQLSYGRSFQESGI